MNRAGLRIVGGPPDARRPVYVAREADAALAAAIAAGHHCHVLAPSGTGKTQLARQAVERLRESGTQIAWVDLDALGSRNVAGDPGRWYYSFAWRVVRELRLRQDMNAWWQDRANLTLRQRLRDFFLELVLAGTRQEVVVVIDHLEAVQSQRAAWEIFDAIRACHDARVNEPDCQRLSFLLLGEPGADRLVARRGTSPFEVSTAIALPDFDHAQTAQLARALLPLPVAAAVTDRVWHWTTGHPYLTHRLLASLAPRIAAVDGNGWEQAVDDSVGQLFISRAATRDEPHLAGLAARVQRAGPLRAERLTLCGKLAKGVRVATDTQRFAQRDLVEWGVAIDDEGELVHRNAVYRGAFTALWANRLLPLTARSVAAVVAALLVIILAVPIVYSEYLPRPWVHTLASADSDYESARLAWQRLGLLPGFGTMADRLYGQYLVERSGRATRLAEVERLAAELERLPHGGAGTEKLRAAFWDRRANAMAARGDRDAAVVYALEALEQSSPARRARLRELLFPGFRRLAGTIRPAAALVDLEADPVAGLVTLLDANHELSVWRVGPGEPQRQQRLQLAAPGEADHRALLGPAGRLALSWRAGAAPDARIAVHEVATDRIVATIRQPPGLRTLRFVLGGTALLLATDADLRLHETTSGRLLWRRDDILGDIVGIEMADNGRYALLRPATVAATGWLVDLQRQELRPLRLPVGGALALDPLGRRIALAAGTDAVEVQDVAGGVSIRCQLSAPVTSLRFDPTGRWLLAITADARLVALAVDAGCRRIIEREGVRRWLTAFALDGSMLAAGNLSRGLELIELPSGRRLGSSLQPGMAGAGAAPGSRAAMPRVIPSMGLALTYDGRKAVKLWSLRQAGGVETPHEPGAAQFLVAPDGRTAALGGSDGNVALLPLTPGPARAAAAAQLPGAHVAAVTRLAFDAAGSLVASGALDGSVIVRDVASGAARGRIAAHDDGAITALRFLPGSRLLVTASARSVRIVDLPGTIRARLPVTGQPPSLAVDADGRLVYVGGDGDGVTRWDWRSGQSESVVPASFRVRTLGLSDDGRLLATAGADRVVRIWPAGAASALRQSWTVPAMVESLWFDAPGRRLWLKAGAWVTRLEVGPDGLSSPDTRPLPDPDTRITRLADGSGILLVARAASADPLLFSLPAGGSWAPPAGDAAAIPATAIRSRLALEIGSDGELRAIER